MTVLWIVALSDLGDVLHDDWLDLPPVRDGSDGVVESCQAATVTLRPTSAVAELEIDDDAFEVRRWGRWRSMT